MAMCFPRRQSILGVVKFQNRQFPIQTGRHPCSYPTPEHCRSFSSKSSEALCVLYRVGLVWSVGWVTFSIGPPTPFTSILYLNHHVVFLLILAQIVRKNQHIWHVGVWVGLYEWVSFKRWQRILQPADNANCSTLYHFQSTQIQLYFYKNTFIYLWKYNCKSIEIQIQIWTKTIANTKWYQHVRGGSNYFNLLIH